jgi:hypothetical protein
MQIVQFLVGVSYAAPHSFIAYTIPSQAHISNDASGSTSHTEYYVVSCITTSGETFAIWFNVLYLTPLTVLIVRFFVKSYFRSTKGTSESLSRKALWVMRGDRTGMGEKLQWSSGWGWKSVAFVDVLLSDQYDGMLAKNVHSNEQL